MFLLQPEERLSIESMRTSYYRQLQKYLEPETALMHSKVKLIATDSQNLSVHQSSPTKMKHDLFRNQHAQNGFSSFDTTALIEYE